MRNILVLILIFIKVLFGSFFDDFLKIMMKTIFEVIN